MSCVAAPNSTAARSNRAALCSCATQSADCQATSDRAQMGTQPWRRVEVPENSLDLLRQRSARRIARAGQGSLQQIGGHRRDCKYWPPGVSTIVRRRAVRAVRLAEVARGRAARVASSGPPWPLARRTEPSGTGVGRFCCCESVGYAGEVGAVVRVWGREWRQVPAVTASSGNTDLRRQARRGPLFTVDGQLQTMSIADPRPGRGPGPCMQLTRDRGGRVEPGRLGAHRELIAAESRPWFVRQCDAPIHQDRDRRVEDTPQGRGELIGPIIEHVFD